MKILKQFSHFQNYPTNYDKNSNSNENSNVNMNTNSVLRPEYQGPPISAMPPMPAIYPYPSGSPIGGGIMQEPMIVNPMYCPYRCYPWRKKWMTTT